MKFKCFELVIVEAGGNLGPGHAPWLLQVSMTVLVLFLSSFYFNLVYFILNIISSSGVTRLFRRELMTEAQLNGPAISALAMLGQESRLRQVRLALLGSK